MPRRWVRACLAVGLVVLAASGWWHRRTTEPSRDHGSPALASLRGRVSADEQPVTGARVRLKGGSRMVLTDDLGRFQLDVPPQEGQTITAAKAGYLIAGVPTAAEPLEIRLTPLPAADSRRYEWVDPAPRSDESGACGNCHQAIFDEWQADGHARSAVSRQFQATLAALAQDFPEGVEVCWSCHAPTLEPERANFDLRHVTGTPANGVHCDFCHKIRDAHVEQAGLTHGRFGYELLRPAAGQIFFGPLDDVDRGDDAYSALYGESRFCASCHEGTLFGVHVYGTWSEWLASPARRQGRQCQTCHMAPSGSLTNIAPAAGGIDRDPKTLASHTFLPGGYEAMLRRALNLAVGVERRPSSVDVSLRLEARDVGHRVPTGFIDRQLLLVVEAFDAMGQTVDSHGGDRLPATAGELATKAGRLFARVLADSDGKSPVPFWRAGVSMTDTRLSPEEPIDSSFRFSTDAALVRVRLIYRRSWQESAEQGTVVYDRSFPCR